LTGALDALEKPMDEEDSDTPVHGVPATHS
jgi:hypothetical protein